MYLSDQPTMLMMKGFLAEARGLSRRACINRELDITHRKTIQGRNEVRRDE
jgi:hypothetical protein